MAQTFTFKNLVGGVNMGGVKMSDSNNHVFGYNPSIYLTFYCRVLTDVKKFGNLVVNIKGVNYASDLDFTIDPTVDTVSIAGVVSPPNSLTPDQLLEALVQFVSVYGNNLSNVVTS